MPSFPVVRRGLLVVAIGAAVALSHVTFAVAQTDATETLAENCYYETQSVVSKGGKEKKVRVVECD